MVFDDNNLKENVVKQKIISIVIIGLIGINCIFASGRKEGNGNVVTLERPVSALFDSITLSEKATVNIYQNENPKITLEIDSNLEKYVKTDINNGVLEIKETLRVSLQPNVYIINVYIPNIYALKISGSGNIILKDIILSNELYLNISGSGEIIGNIECNRIETKISGSGGIRLSGKCEEALIEISGSGNYECIDLEIINANVEISGSGDVNITAINSLNGKISGPGNVMYKGNPEIQFENSGKGKIIAIE
jgi:hypothetical protein